MTLLDQAHQIMEDNPDDPAMRLQFFERLADSELFLMLESEPVGDRIAPQTFRVDDQTYALVFDREERLADFTGTQTPYVAMSGRKIAALLQGQNLGLGVNLSVAPSSILLPSTALEWLNQTLANQAAITSDQVKQFHAPAELTEEFLRALDIKLASTIGLADCAFLVGATYHSGQKGNVLAFLNAPQQAQSALRQAVTEAVSFSPTEISLDITFIEKSNPNATQLESAGLKFDLSPADQQSSDSRVKNPGMNPNAPPRLL